MSSWTLTNTSHGRSNSIRFSMSRLSCVCPLSANRPHWFHVWLAFGLTPFQCNNQLGWRIVVWCLFSFCWFFFFFVRRCEFRLSLSCFVPARVVGSQYFRNPVPIFYCPCKQTPHFCPINIKFTCSPHKSATRRHNNNKATEFRVGRVA